MHKTYVFRTPSNEKIEVDSRVYSFFRDMITVEDLKFLFTSKERLYSMEAFELAFFNKVTKQKDLLNHDTKLCDLEITEYLVIHVDVPKTTVEPDFVKKTIVDETRVRKIVKKAVDTIKDEKAVVAAVEKVADVVVDKAVIASVEKVADVVVDKAVVEKVAEAFVDVDKSVVEKVAEAFVDVDKAVVEKVAEAFVDVDKAVVEKVAEAVVDKSEKVENAVEMVVNEKPELVVDDAKTEEEVVKKKFCIVC